ncbi:hypothetical protein ACWDAZ_40770, partial [Streptomyces sp. NPDC001215]
GVLAHEGGQGRGVGHGVEERLLDSLADTDGLLLGTHFPHPTAGTVHTDGTRYRLHPEPGTATPLTSA